MSDPTPIPYSPYDGRWHDATKVVPDGDRWVLYFRNITGAINTASYTDKAPFGRWFCASSRGSANPGDLWAEIPRPGDAKPEGDLRELRELCEWLDDQIGTRKGSEVILLRTRSKIIRRIAELERAAKGAPHA